MGSDGTAASGPAHGAAWFAQSRSWTGYFDVMAGTPPRPLLLDALERFDRESQPPTPMAVDLGCGEGRDTVELLRRGWRVVAIDNEPEAFDRLLARDDLTHPDRLETRRRAYHQAALPRAALVNAAYALPFCASEHFGAAWRRIVCAIEPGGRFVGQLFGDRDGWVGRPGFSHVRRAELDRLFVEFVIEHLEEEERDGRDKAGFAKHWHVFHLIARKRTRMIHPEIECGEAQLPAPARDEQRDEPGMNKG